MNRTESQPFARLLRRATDPARSAGTVMLLVVGVLLLVLIVGMTYMHVVQEDRRAGLTVDIDAIVLAQADLVGIKLLEDLAIGSTGQHFADLNTNGTTNGTPDGLPDQEPYDYPGDEDKWLASTSPEAAGTAWPQVSLLGEGFWNGTNSSDTTRTLTAGNAVGASKQSNGSADADGDAILDSKPEQAAVSTRGGLVFFAWTRVEDLSSKANLNVWHSQVSSGGAYSAATDAPRWWYPGELDLGGLVSSLTGVNAQYTNGMTADMPGLMGLRGASATMPTPWGITTAGQRGHGWLLNGKFYENPQGTYKSLHMDTGGSFDATNELELRYRNGLVYLDTEAEIEETGRMRNMLRGNVTSAESAWNDGVPGVTSIANYFTNEPRHQFTTYSGASMFRMPLGTDTSTPFWGKRDINKILTSANPAANLSTEITRVYGSGSPPLPSGVTSAAELADQFAANIVDYVDDDNILTVQNGRYGYEALPYIAEVYTHLAYEVTAAAGGPPTWSCTLAPQGMAYAIEFRNPTQKEISLENIRLLVDNASSTWGTATLDTLAGQTTLAGGKTLVLYKNAPDPNGDMTALVDNTEVPVTKAITPDIPQAGGGPSQYDFILQVLDSTGAWVTYQTATGYRFNGAFVGPFNIDDAADPTGNYLNLQGSLVGNGNGMNVMTMHKTDFVASGFELNYNSYSNLDRLGTADKTAIGPANKISPTTNQFVVADRADLSAPSVPPITHVGELFHIPVFGPTPTLTIAQVWGTATDASTFTLSPQSTTKFSNSVDYSVSHAVLLADRFTTLSPREDGVDNDGDGTVDEADEVFIPGTLNINTAPEFLMDRVIPIPNAAVRQAYVDAIIAYRDTPNTTNRTTGDYRPGREGFAYVSEVYNLGALAAGNDLGRNTTDDFNVGGVQADFLSNPPTGADNISDDPEEKSLVARWLGQTCSTRSDTYVAYILVRGYTPGNLTTPVTERRAAVLLDRSRVVADGDGVRVLGIVWY